MIWEGAFISRGDEGGLVRTWPGRNRRLLVLTLIFCATQSLAHAESPNEETLESLMAQGQEVYDRTCVVCHQPSGMGLSGSFPPLVAGAPFDADPSIIEPLERLGLYEDGAIKVGKLETQIDVVVHGIPGTRMFAFGPQLSDEEIAAVVTYIRNAWGNDTGDIATAEQVEMARQD